MIFKFCLLFVCVVSNVYSAKVTLYDSTRQRDDLNWSKISFKDTSTTNSLLNTNWIQERLNSKSDTHGWKESSFSSSGGDDVWRIHFVCDLNVQNIQNWLFTPLINTKTANRVTLNLTFTIRECENLPVKQVKNCREKFELYFEETQKIDEDFSNLENEQNRSDIYFLNKIKQLRFKDTFVSDTGLRYYNSVVDRQKQKSNLNRLGESSINVELREIPLSGLKNQFVRFAIRDTGACISLLSVEVSYVTCPAFNKFGIFFPETSTGKDLTDLVQVTGKCPENSVNTQSPKAICTAKGEWLITDSSLSTKCLCTSGYEFINDKCLECPIGYFKSTDSNDQKCEPCPQNSWSSSPGMSKCECLKGYFKEDDTDYSSPCKPIPQISSKNIIFEFLNDDKINITLNRLNLQNSKKIQTELKCFQCGSDSTGTSNPYSMLNNMKCDINCFVLSTQNDQLIILNRNLNQISRVKLVVKQKLGDREISQNYLYLNLKQERLQEEKFVKCESQNDMKNFCLNMSINFQAKNELISKIKQNKLLRSNIYGLVQNNEFQLIPSDYQANNFKSTYIKLPSGNLIKNILDRNSTTSLIYCDSNQIDKIKFQFEFDSSNDLSSIKNNFDVFTFDFKIVDLCPQKEKIVTEFITNHAFVKLTEAAVLSNIEQINQQNGQALKIHVILPIILSFILVFCLFILAIFVRKFKADKNENFNKFINKKCSSKCNSCNSTNTSCSSSSTSSSPSTICTTSQIIERESKLYYVDPHTYEDPTLAVQEFAQEISPLDIKIESVIGGGEFGDVCKGKLKNVSSNWITVAIKTLKVGSSEKNRCDFLTEASIMAQFHHENIICLEGVVTQSHPFMIITEYMDNGSLDTFLRLNSWRLNIYDLIKMLKDISNGMKYLSEMNFVHRDLAARNILVDKDLKCKVADFGLSREIEGTNTEGVYWTKGGKIPVRWTAPEAITHTKFTCSSDVWSYGVVMWEVLSFGERPYWNWSNTDVIKAVDKGFRLFIPPNCPQVLYNMMLDCWEADRLKRPKFKKITSDLDLLIKSKKECLYVPTKNTKQNQNIDTNRPNFTHLTSVQEWLNSLNLVDYTTIFVNKRLANLSQVLSLELEDLIKLEIFDKNHQMIILDSLKRIQFELNFQNGFLV